MQRVSVNQARVRVDPEQTPMVIKAMGHGKRQMCRMDRYGFPRTSAKSARRVHGFKTGDLVRAVVPKGKNAGTHLGRVAIRASGSFNISTQTGIVQGLGYRHCRRIQQADGYTYPKGEAHSSVA